MSDVKLNPMMSIAELLQWKRRMGYTHASAAAALGVHITSFTNWTRGKTLIDRRTELACKWIEHIKE
jgi:hypothetical protein